MPPTGSWIWWRAERRWKLRKPGWEDADGKGETYRVSDISAWACGVQYGSIPTILLWLRQRQGFLV